MVLGHGNQNSLHLPAGHVLGMDYAATGMSTFASEIKRYGILLTRLKAHTHFGQFLDASGAVFNDHLDHIRITEAVSRVQGILNMEVKRIVRAQHRGDSSLGVIGAGFDFLLFGHHRNLAAIRYLEGVGEAGDATADHQGIICHCVHNFLTKKTKRL